MTRAELDALWGHVEYLSHLLFQVDANLSLLRGSVDTLTPWVEPAFYETLSMAVGQVERIFRQAVQEVEDVANLASQVPAEVKVPSSLRRLAGPVGETGRLGDRETGRPGEPERGWWGDGYSYGDG